MYFREKSKKKTKKKQNNNNNNNVDEHFATNVTISKKQVF